MASIDRADRQPFTRQLLWTFVIQGAGAALGLATVVWLGARHGPAEQGLFSRTKTELEFLLSLGALGLPQAFLYHVQSGSVSVPRALRLSWVGALLGAAGSLGYAFVRGDVPSPVALIVAVAAMVWHGSVRAVLLGVLGGRAFNLVTALPQALVFVGVVATAAAGHINSSNAAVIMALSFGAAGLLGHLLSVRALRYFPVPTAELPAFDILRYGAATWLSAIGVNLSVLICTLFVQDHRPSAELGVFTSAVVLGQLALTPLNYALPLLFKRWIEEAVGPRLLVHMAKASAVPALASIACAGAASWGLEAPWLGAYGRLLPLAWIIFAGIAAEVFVKLAAVALLGAGHPWRAALGDVARASFSAVLILTLGHSLGLAGVVGVWAGASFVAGVTLAAARPWRGRPRDPAADSAGRPTAEDASVNGAAW